MGNKQKIAVQAELILTLNTFNDWCNKCPSHLPKKRTAGEYFLFVDTNGNFLFGGSDFMEAEKRRTFPVKVYRPINVCNSHSPTEPTISDINDPANGDSSLIEFQHLEFDTLQEGDWFIGTEEEYRKVLELEAGNNPLRMIDSWVSTSFNQYGYIIFDGVQLCWVEPCKKAQLTAPEFIRRAENTFKNQK
jgi:hypothetical protein